MLRFDFIDMLIDGQLTLLTNDPFHEPKAYRDGVFARVAQVLDSVLPLW